MPTHLADHLGAGRHIPGIFVINPGLHFDEIVAILLLAAEIAEPGEHRDQIWHLQSL